MWFWLLTCWLARCRQHPYKRRYLCRFVIVSSDFFLRSAVFLKFPFFWLWFQSSDSWIFFKQLTTCQLARCHSHAVVSVATPICILVTDSSENSFGLRFTVYFVNPIVKNLWFQPLTTCLLTRWRPHKHKQRHLCTFVVVSFVGPACYFSCSSFEGVCWQINHVN
jgi:hypothetical protein